jgi:hypothetical protein
MSWIPSLAQHCCRGGAVVSPVRNQSPWPTARPAWARLRARTCCSVPSTSVTSAGEARSRLIPRGTPWPSTTTASRWVPLPRLVLPTSTHLLGGSETYADEALAPGQVAPHSRPGQKLLPRCKPHAFPIPLAQSLPSRGMACAKLRGQITRASRGLEDQKDAFQDRAVVLPRVASTGAIRKHLFQLGQVLVLYQAFCHAQFLAESSCKKLQSTYACCACETTSNPKDE